WIGVGTNASNSADTTPACENNLSGGYVIQGQTVQALDLLDTARGQGFIEFAFTSEIPDPPACEQTITEPAVTSTRQGVLNGTGTGTPTSTAAITLAEYTATGDPCPDELQAITDEYTTVQDTTLTGNVLDNDVIPAGSTVTVTGPGAGPWNGDLTLNEDGTFTYTPAPGYVGTDSFSYTITDQDNNTSVGTVNITITEDENGIPLIAPGAAATAGLIGLAGLGLGYTRRRREATNEVI
ncbi:Ig-like domain-containing protein, partial [Cellulosimicrobium cellulans]